MSVQHIEKIEEKIDTLMSVQHIEKIEEKIDTLSKVIIELQVAIAKLIVFTESEKDKHITNDRIHVDFEVRLRILEKWQWKTMGMVALASIPFGSLAAWIVYHLLGSG